ncbi:hypothetical protein MGWOODY_Smn3587 [hydrothermal vent metagenome]|uniref:Uncharacterized protein n=1 Tax=hydrothermal vent metagenome TaxID=652676 RepID=A0A160TGD9_9ZZZZ
MDRRRQLHHAKTRPKVTTRHPNRRYRLSSQLIRQLPQLRHR